MMEIVRQMLIDKQVKITYLSWHELGRIYWKTKIFVADTTLF